MEISLFSLFPYFPYFLLLSVTVEDFSSLIVCIQRPLRFAFVSQENKHNGKKGVVCTLTSISLAGMGSIDQRRWSEGGFIVLEGKASG